MGKGKPNPTPTRTPTPKPNSNQADPILRPLLCATKGFPLLSIKPDAYWGVDPRDGGRNRLAELWMELRDEVC